MGFWLVSSGRIAEMLFLAMAGGAVEARQPEPVFQLAVLETEAFAASISFPPIAVPQIAIAPFTPPPIAPSERARGFVDLSPRAMAIDGEISRAQDGLFYLNAQVNGVPVRFLVDTGASTIVLTPADAERAGVLPEEDAFRHSAETAGGRTAMARIRLAHLAAGPAERNDVEAVVASAGLHVSLLGQSWLSQLESVTITGDRMVLR